MNAEDDEHRQQAMRFLQQGMTAQFAAERLGVSPRSVRQWRFEARQGKQGAGNNPGVPVSLEAGVLADVAEVLRQGPRAHGFARMQWSAGLIAEVINERHGLGLTARQAQRFLLRHGLKWKFPELLDNPRWPK